MPRARACVCFSEGKTPLMRCPVVFQAVTCQGSSGHLSITVYAGGSDQRVPIHIFALQAWAEQHGGQPSR